VPRFSTKLVVATTACAARWNRLIAAYERSQDFIESPAFEAIPELLIDDRNGGLAGELIGHYRIESLIGVGGMGEV
jgi:hypothetical protein